MAGRRARGRQRIDIQYIQDDNDRHATFSKRRRGLYKKASELSTFCGANVGIIIISQANKAHSFWHPSADIVIANHRNQYVPPREESPLILYYNGRLDGLLDQKDELKKREREVDEAMRTQPGRDWEGLDMDGLGEVDVTNWKTYFTHLNSNVNQRLNQPEVGPSTSGFGESSNRLGDAGANE